MNKEAREDRKDSETYREKMSENWKKRRLTARSMFSFICLFCLSSCLNFCFMKFSTSMRFEFFSFLKEGIWVRYFVYSFNKHLWRTCLVAGTVLVLSGWGQIAGPCSLRFAQPMSIQWQEVCDPGLPGSVFEKPLTRLSLRWFASIISNECLVVKDCDPVMFHLYTRDYYPKACAQSRRG